MKKSLVVSCLVLFVGVGGSGCSFGLMNAPPEHYDAETASEPPDCRMSVLPLAGDLGLIVVSSTATMVGGMAALLGDDEGPTVAGAGLAGMTLSSISFGYGLTSYIRCGRAKTTFEDRQPVGKARGEVGPWNGQDQDSEHQQPVLRSPPE